MHPEGGRLDPDQGKNAMDYAIYKFTAKSILPGPNGLI